LSGRTVSSHPATNNINDRRGHFFETDMVLDTKEESGNETWPVDAHQGRRLFTVKALVGMDLSVPGVQRSLDEDRVANIIEFQRSCFQRCGTLCFIGDIILFDVGGSSDGCGGGGGKGKGTATLALVDGLHRFEAMKTVHRLHPEYVVSATIVYPAHGLTLEKAFLLINMARPVPEWVINTTMQHTKRVMLDGVRAELLREFKPYASSAQAPRPPNFNLERLISELLTSCVTDNLRTVNDVIGFVKFANAHLGRRDFRIRDAALKKAAKSSSAPAYFAADPAFSWMTDDTLLRDYSNLHSVSTAVREHGDEISKDTHKKKRRAIPRTIRHLLWKTHFGESPRGVCACCTVNTVEYTTFHAGHIHSHANGGSDTLSNLLPICAPCNLGMGSTNYDEFRATYGLDGGATGPPLVVMNDSPEKTGAGHGDGDAMLIDD